MEKFITLIMAVIFVCTIPVYAASEPDKMPFEVNADSAVLMEAETGTILYSKNADLALPPASVTKIMTMLLFMEEVDSGNISLSEKISVSEYAASMEVPRYILSPERQ